MATRLISLTDLSSQQLDAWRRLVLRAAEPNPFFEPYYLLATIQRVDASGAHLLVVERDGEWLACVPVRRRGAPPLGALQSWCDEYCFLGTPLVDRDHVPDAVEDLVSATIRRHRVLVLERLALDGPIGATVEELVESRRYQLVLERRSDRAAAVRRADDEPPAPSGKEASELRRLRRRLEGELGGPAEIRDRSDDPEAIEDFLQLEVSSWKGRAKTAFGSRPADVAFLRRVTTAFREQGRLRVLELAGNGTPVAIVCNLVAGDTVFWFKTAFDETYRKASPGVQLTYAARDDFYEHDARLLDSCSAPDSPVVNKVLPDRRPVATLVIGPAGLRGTLMRGAAHAAVRVRARRKAAERSRS